MMYPWLLYKGNKNPEDLLTEVTFEKRRATIRDSSEFTILLDLERLLVYTYKRGVAPYIYIRRDLLDE